jgi:protein-L-isoaspartate(D-aspartate) O-methyltransferase
VGTGYYSAILSELAGASGHVHAIELDPDLAAHAQTALADRANVSVINANGSHGRNKRWMRLCEFRRRAARGILDRKTAAGERLVLPLGVPP